MNGEEKLNSNNIRRIRHIQNQIDSQHNILGIKKPDVDSLEFVIKIQEERK